MTTTDDAPSQPSHDEAEPGRPGRRRGADAVLEVCPFLVAGDNPWRSAFPSREHRCGALRPSAPLAVSKQRELCLVRAHRACATYTAAVALAAEAAPTTPGDAGAALWPRIRPVPLVLEADRRIPGIRGATPRSGGQALLIVLMVLAFLVLVIAQTTSPPAPGAGDAASRTPASAVPPTAVEPTATPAASTASSPQPSATPVPATATSKPATPAPSAQPSSNATRSYEVRSGDTLSGIAVRFGTTVKVLKELNGITDPRLIKPGQVLLIP